MKLNRSPKFTVKIANSNGFEYLPSETKSFGNQNGPYTIAKKFVIKNGNCTVALDRRNITGINDNHTVSVGMMSGIPLTPASPIYNMIVYKGLYLKLQIGLNGSKINVTNFPYSVPIYVDSPCTFQEVY